MISLVAENDDENFVIETEAMDITSTAPLKVRDRAHQFIIITLLLQRNAVRYSSLIARFLV